MYRRILAFDFDGTLAEEGVVPPALQQTLKQLHVAGCSLFLVTGRRFKSMSLGDLQAVFSGIVWENGAVLSYGPEEKTYMPFGYVSPDLIKALEEAGVVLEYGLAIVSTWASHEAQVHRTLAEHGGDTVLIRNKGALMILPAGTAKGPGLEKLLDLCRLSPRNLVSFGDGENDVSLLQLGEVGITVSNAAPALKLAADLVIDKPGPAGVLEALETYWLKGDPGDIPSREVRSWVSLGRDTNGEPVYLPATELVNSNLGIFGDSSTGKSLLAGLIAQSLHLSGYQVLMANPEGNFHGLRLLPGVITLQGEPDGFPTPQLVAMLLAETSLSLVLDLCSFPAAEREVYTGDLLRHLHPLRESKARPHWIVLDEAQSLLNDPDAPLVRLMGSMLYSGGYALITYRPDWLPLSVLETLHHTMITGISDPATVDLLGALFHLPPEIPLQDIPLYHVLLDGGTLFSPQFQQVEHIRHLYKYLDMPLPMHKRFYFHSPEGSSLDMEAASLFEFKQLLETVPPESLLYHQQRGDFESWIRKVLDDRELADRIEEIDAGEGADGTLGERLLHCVTKRYIEMQASRQG
jgi:hypothetical protein